MKLAGEYEDKTKEDTHISEATMKQSNSVKPM